MEDVLRSLMKIRQDKDLTLEDLGPDPDLRDLGSDLKVAQDLGAVLDQDLPTSMNLLNQHFPLMYLRLHQQIDLCLKKEKEPFQLLNQVIKLVTAQCTAVHIHSRYKKPNFSHKITGF